jgi:hypothetical protein
MMTDFVVEDSKVASVSEAIEYLREVPEEVGAYYFIRGFERAYVLFEAGRFDEFNAWAVACRQMILSHSGVNVTKMDHAIRAMQFTGPYITYLNLTKNLHVPDVITSRRRVKEVDAPQDPADEEVPGPRSKRARPTP